MANTPKVIPHIRNLVSKDDLATALKELSNLLEGSPHLNEAIFQTARYSDILRQIRLGTVDFQAANLTKNQIRLGVLDLLQFIDETEIIPSQKEDRPAEKQNGNISIIQNADKIYNIEHIDNANFS